MQYETAEKFWCQCLQLVTSGGTKQYMENIAVLFTEDAKEGKFDQMTEEAYNALLSDVEELAKLWDNQPRKEAGALLLNAMAKTTISPEQMKLLAGTLARCFAESRQSKDCCAGNGSGTDAVFTSALAVRPPKKIRNDIARQVLGQDEAVRAAAMITYNHLAGRRSNAVFVGPSGCGKSEIWRVLSKEYPGMIRMMDFSRFTADGWNGSLHLRDIFNGTDPDAIRERGLIVVLDEADKIVCEHAIGGGGTDYNALLQNDLLKMMDGDVIEFGEQNKLPALSVDCSKISIIMLGAFERLLEGKVRNTKHIGFGPAPQADAESHKNISYHDLIHAGMRREVAGRVNKIVALTPLSQYDYTAILKDRVLPGLQEAVGCKLSMDRSARDALAEQAIASKLGVRWMRSAVQNAVDEALFDTPNAAACTITLQDGALRCRTRGVRKTVAPKPLPQNDSQQIECGLNDELPF